jgi:hypothetical protein
MKRELRTRSVGTKVSEAELRVLESRAAAAGLTLSEWVRDVLLGSSVEMGTLAAERAILVGSGFRAMCLCRDVHDEPCVGWVATKIQQESLKTNKIEFANSIQKEIRPQRITVGSRSPVSSSSRPTGCILCGATL